MHLIDPLYQPCRQGEPPVKKHAPIIVEALVPFGQSDGRRNEGRLCATIELGKDSGQPIKLPSFDIPLNNAVIQHIPLVEATHHDEPIHRFPWTADGKPLGRPDQRQDVEIYILGEAAIEAQLSPAAASRLATLEKSRYGKRTGFFSL